MRVSAKAGFRENEGVREKERAKERKDKSREKRTTERCLEVLLTSVCVCVYAHRSTFNKFFNKTQFIPYI